MWLPMLVDNACMNMHQEVSSYDCVSLVIMNIINLKGGLHVTPKNLPWLRACCLWFNILPHYTKCMQMIIIIKTTNYGQIDLLEEAG